MIKSKNEAFNKFFDIVTDDFTSNGVTGILIRSNVSLRFYIADQEFVDEFRESDLESFKEVMHYVDEDCYDFEVMPIHIYDNNNFRCVIVD